MSANQTQDEKGIFSSSVEIPDTPSPEQTLARPKRNVTPRGPRFLNLDEAHRNITSRLMPDHPFRKPFGESQSSANIPLQELSSPTSTDITDGLDTPGVLRRHASDFVSPYPSRSMAGRSLTDRQSIAQRRKKNAEHNIEASTTKNNEDNHDVDRQAQNHDITSSTVCRIVDQYAATSSDRVSPSLDDSDFAYTFKPPGQTTGAGPQLGHNGETNQIAMDPGAEVHQVTSSQPNLHLPEIETGSPNASKLTEIHSMHPSENDCLSGLGMRRCPQTTLAQKSSSPQASSPGTTGEINAECHGDVDSSHYTTRNLIPPPLRIPNNQSQNSYIGTPEKLFTNDTESSLGAGHGDTSTDSNDDPFKYDNEYYRRIRQLGKEREVSCALGRLNRDTFVESIVHSPYTSPINRDELMEFTHERTSATAQPPIDGGRQSGSFFDPVAFSALHGDILCTQDADVKVMINKASKPSDQSHDSPNISTFGLSVDPENFTQGQSPYGQAADADWVTEATSETDLNTVLRNGQISRGIKETGSSIADYSDDGYGTPFSRFGSQDRILQHSSERSGGQETHAQKFSTRSDNRRAHIIRSNVIAHGSSRFNPSLPTSANSQGGIFNPFRRDYKRADASSYFTYKTDNNGRSKYEFRDSTSTYDPVVNDRQASCHSQGTLPSTSMGSFNTAKLFDENADPFTSPTDGILRGGNMDSDKQNYGHSQPLVMRNIPVTSNNRHSSLKSNEQDQSIKQAASDYEEGPPSTISKFSFKLLDLSEAQELERMRRESEETNKTGQTLKYHRSLSKLSTRSTPLPVPSTAYLGRNSHVRKGSRLSSTFTPPPWQILGDDGTPGTSEYTALDASASPSRALAMPHDIGAETPTATRNRVFKNNSLKGHRSRLLPVDKRIRSKNIDRRLQNDTNSGITAVRVAEDHYISYKAMSRRQLFFYAMLSLSTLPFFALLVLNGSFDNSLAWLTHGEVCRLTKKQRRVIKLVFIAECIIYASLVAAIIVYYVTATKVHH